MLSSLIKLDRLNKAAAGGAPAPPTPPAPASKPTRAPRCLPLLRLGSGRGGAPGSKGAQKKTRRCDGASHRRHSLEGLWYTCCLGPFSCLLPGRHYTVRGQKIMHRPGIEPGSSEWKSEMLPLHHRCDRVIRLLLLYLLICVLSTAMRRNGCATRGRTKRAGRGTTRRRRARRKRRATRRRRRSRRRRRGGGWWWPFGGTKSSSKGTGNLYGKSCNPHLPRPLQGCRGLTCKPSGWGIGPFSFGGRCA